LCKPFLNPHHLNQAAWKRGLQRKRKILDLHFIFLKRYITKIFGLLPVPAHNRAGKRFSRQQKAEKSRLGG